MGCVEGEDVVGLGVDGNGVGLNDVGDNVDGLAVVSGENVVGGTGEADGVYVMLTTS